MFRKHTQLQNITLATQVNTPSTSEVMEPPGGKDLEEIDCPESDTNLRFTIMKVTVPANAANTETIKPGRERSTMYHKTGLTRTSVRIA